MADTDNIYKVNDQGMIVEEIDEPGDNKGEKVITRGSDGQAILSPVQLVA